VKLRTIIVFLLLGSACCEPSESTPLTAESATATSLASATSSTSASEAPGPPPFAWENPDLKAPGDRWGDQKKWSGTFEEQNAHLIEQLAYVNGLRPDQVSRIKAVFASSKRVSQGNPDAARHPVTVAQCQRKLAKLKVNFDDEAAARRCGARYMAPLYDPEKKQTFSDAPVCIDRFEFPNIPCAYPVTWVRANEAVALCQAMGKRLCDAHEWEGACYGRLRPPDYEFDLFKRMQKDDARKSMRARRNSRVIKDKRWAYGPKFRKGVCGTSSRKSKNCGVGWRKCGTNTFPAGFFTDCVSPLGVYDQHGNAAEHMNLPLSPDQLASSPLQHYGHTEMKGSWFVFDIIHAHEDHCLWRAPYWHGTKVMNEGSHRNYHLGFRCCKSLEPR